MPKEKINAQSLMQIIWDVCQKPTLAILKGNKIEGAVKQVFGGGKEARWIVSRPLQGYELLDRDEMWRMREKFGYEFERTQPFDPQRPDDLDTNGGDT
jgi:hypothetical protein